MDKKPIEIKERLFRIVNIAGLIVSILAYLETRFLLLSNVLVISFTVLIFSFALSTFITFRFHQYRVSAIFMWFILNQFVFPMIFFFGGGATGGAALWFILGIFYVFMTFDGARLYVFLVLTLLWDMGVFALGYVHPDLCIPLETQKDMMLDSCFGVIAIGVTCGTVMQFQIQKYHHEREVVRQQKEELERYAQAQSVFFSGLSHEIRTPMNSVIGLNEMILRKASDEEILGYAKDIQVSGELLLELINDILDFSQLSQKRMTIVPVTYSPKDVLQNLVDIMQVRIKEKGLTLQVSVDENVPSLLNGDSRRIQQVLLNLLTNAVKYTNEGSVSVRMRIKEAVDDKARIEYIVQDTGIGIHKEDIAGLFDAFSRADNSKNHKIEGTGLGLPICKEIVSLMDGKIEVDSIYGVGSTFTLYLEQDIVDRTPLSESIIYVGRGEKEEYTNLFTAPKARLLVVDDNDMNLRVVTNLLSETKMTIDTATSAKEMLANAQKTKYDVILLDYMMPDMDGAAALALLRKEENRNQSSPVILLSALPKNESDSIVRENGFSGSIQKPMRSEVIEKEIYRLLPKTVIEKSNLVKIESTFAKQMKQPLVITTDCVSDLPEELMNIYGIKAMYLYIRTKSGRFADTKEISSDSLAQYVSSEKTRAYSDSVSVEEYTRFFADILNDAKQVLHISLGANSGKSYGVALEAATKFEHVTVLDSGNISCGEGLLVLCAAKMAQEGAGKEEIIEMLEKKKKHLFNAFVAPSAKVFYQSGYTDAFRASVCHALRLHPLLTMKKSRIQLAGFFPGSLEKSWSTFIRHSLMKRKHIDTDIICISYVALSQAQQEFIRREILKRVPFKNVVMQRASFSNAINVGLYTFGIAFLYKE